MSAKIVHECMPAKSLIYIYIYVYMYIYRNVTQVHASGNRSWVHHSETAYT